MKKAIHTASTSKTATNGHVSAATLFLRQVESNPLPRFTSVDKRVSWEHRPLSLEALLLIKELPGSFTAALSAAYEDQLNQAFGGATKQAERPALNAPEFVAGMRQLVISTAVNPHFHDGEDDPDHNLVNVAHISAYLQEFFTYALELAATGPVPLANGSEVSAAALKDFPAQG